MKAYLPIVDWQLLSAPPPKSTQDEVHIWCADLNLNDTELEKLKQILDEAEQYRAERFKFSVHRRRFIAARGFLKKILSSYLQVPAEEIIFAYGKHGKPFLHQQFKIDLIFNNSASNDLALYAVTLDNEVGIDVEFENKTLDYKGLIERFFSAKENQVFQQLPEGQQKFAFFYGWVQKEAFVKAIGMGLSFGLNNFDVNLDSSKPAQLIAIDGNQQSAKKWQLTAFIPAANFVACVAVENPIKPLKYFKFTE